MKKTGDSLSILGFGCMRLPRKGVGIDEERAIKQIRYAIDHGVNYIDTALLYPGSEQLLGRALKDGYREKVKLATKLFPPYIKSREDMDRVLNLQLKTLYTDHIDYYLIHNLMNVTSFKKLMELGLPEFIESAKKDGRIINIGFSSHCPVGDFKEIVNAYDWDFCQIQYNILDEKFQAGTEGLKYAASKGLGIVIMEPLRGGYLTKNIPPKVQDIWNESEVKRTPAEWALRWIWNHPEVSVVLSGMNEEAHIDENLRVADQAMQDSLTEKELALIGRVEEAYRKELKVNCTGCRYCMPCPAGVDIPGSFAAYNNSNSMMPPKVAYMVSVGGKMTGTKPAYASLCKDCGKCEKLCPQQIPIARHLKQIAKEYETIDAKVIGSIAGSAMKLMRWYTMRKV